MYFLLITIVNIFLFFVHVQKGKQLKLLLQSSVFHKNTLESLNMPYQISATAVFGVVTLMSAITD